MGEYRSSFNVRRYVGAGEGRDVKYDASAKPSLGLYKSIEVVVNGTGPVPNFEGKYDGTQVAVPAGATVTYAYIVTKGVPAGAEKDGVAGVSVSLVNKAGGEALSLFNNETLKAGETVEVSEGAAALIQLAEDRYAKATGLVAGLDAKLIIEYI
jgi:hypothetical protein